MANNKYFLFYFVCVSFISLNVNAQEKATLDSLIVQAQSLHYISPHSADSIYKIALKDAKKTDDKYAIGLIHKGLGVVADVLDQAENAILHYQLSFKSFMENGDTLDAYKAKFNEGKIYIHIKAYQQAERAFTESADIFEEQNFPIGVVLCKTNFAISQFDQGDYRGALQNFYVVKLQAENLNFISSNTYGNIGNCYIKLNEIDSATKYTEKAYQIAIQQEDYWTQCAWSIALGNLYAEQGNLLASIEVLEKGLGLAKTIDSPDSEVSAHEGLRLSYYKLGKYKEAHDQLFMKKKLLDSLTKQDFLLLLSEKEIVIENEKSRNEIALLLEKEKISDLEKSKGEVVQTGLIIGVILVFIIAFLQYRQSKKRQKTNLVLRTKNATIAEQHKEIKDSINYAQQIQAAILTSENEWSKISKDHFIVFQPKDVVSGDFFWAYQNDEKNLAIWVAADCTGHGIPGAFMSMLGVGLLNEIIIENNNYDTSEILNQLRDKIIKAMNSTNDQRKDGMDLSICLWDKTMNTLQFSGANNPIYLIRESDNIETELKPKVREEFNGKSLIEIKGDKMPVGAFTGTNTSFTSSKIKLFKNDILCSFSDGLADQFGGVNGKKYKYKQFRQLLLKNSSLSLKAQGKELFSSFEEWKSDFEQVDDVCVIGIKIP